MLLIFLSWPFVSFHPTPGGRSLSHTNRPASGITNWFILWTSYSGGSLHCWKEKNLKKKNSSSIWNFLCINNMATETCWCRYSCRIPSPSIPFFSRSQRPTKHLLLQKSHFDKPFQGSFAFLKDFLYMCLSSHNVATKEGANGKGFKGEGIEMRNLKSCLYSLLCMKASVCHTWLYELFGHFLLTAKMLKVGHSCVSAWFGSRTGLIRKEC